MIFDYTIKKNRVIKMPLFQEKDDDLFSQPIKVSNIFEEDSFVANISCTKCGNKGTIELGKRRTTYGEDPVCDIFKAKCKKCKKKYVIKFDVTECMKGYLKMKGKNE